MDIPDIEKLKDNVYITLSWNENRIICRRNLVRILGSPKYICVRVNKDFTSLILRPCEATDPMSFKVPENLFTDKGSRFRITSKSFVRGLLDKNGYAENCTYAFKGIYSEQYNTVFVSLENGKEITAEKDPD